MKPLADAQGITIIVAVGCALAVSGDRFLLSKACTNMIKNAIEFSPDGRAIAVTARNNDTVALEVKDGGPGVPDYAIRKLTNRFYALSKPNGQKGSGLGLSFVKEVADLHGATLHIRNNDDMGLSVIMAFPARPTPSP